MSLNRYSDTFIPGMPSSTMDFLIKIVRYVKKKKILFSLLWAADLNLLEVMNPSPSVRIPCVYAGKKTYIFVIIVSSGALKR